MNDVLKNIFDEDSLDAIRNAQAVIPTPRTARRVGNVVAGLSDDDQVDQKEETKIEPSRPEISYEVNAEYEGRIKELNGVIEKHASIINKLIASQNELISEVKQLREKPAERVIVEKVVEKQEEIREPVKKETQSAEKQQTSTGSSLNQDDFSVEKMFYFGNK